MFIHVQDNHLKHKLQTQGKRVAEQIIAGQRPLEKDVNALIMGYKVVGKISQAEGLMKMLVEHSDLKLTPFMFNELISHYCDYGDLEKANFWMDTMVEIGCRPNVYTIRRFVEAIASLKSVDEARVYLYAEVSKALNRKGPVLVSSFTSAYNILFKVCKVNHDTKPVIRIVSDMNKHLVPFDHESLTLILQLMASDGMNSKELIQVIRSSNLKCDAKLLAHQIRSYSRMSGLSSMELISAAEDWFSVYPAFKVKHDRGAYEAVLRVCAKQGNTDKVEVWLEKMKEAGHSVTKTTVLQLLHNYRQIPRWLDELRRAGENMDLYVYSKIITTYMKAKDLKKASRMFYNMLKDGFTPDDALFRNIMISGGERGCQAALYAFARARDGEGATAWISAMKVFGVSPDIKAHNKVVAAFAWDNHTKTREWIRRIEEAGMKPNKETFLAAAEPAARLALFDRVEALAKHTFGTNFEGIDTQSCNLMLFAARGIPWGKCPSAGAQSCPHALRLGKVRDVVEMMGRMKCNPNSHTIVAIYKLIGYENAKGIIEHFHKPWNAIQRRKLDRYHGKHMKNREKMINMRGKDGKRSESREKEV